LRKFINSLQGFVIAMQFLSRVPMGKTIIASDRQWSRSVYFYPLVGAVLGALLVLLASMLSSVPSFLAAVLILTVWVAFTGALHIDGLADCSDGWVGGQGSRQKTLAIMKDPAAGPIAVVVIVLLLLFKLAAIVVLLESVNRFALLIIPMLARTNLLAAFLYAPYANPVGIGAKVSLYLSSKLALFFLLIAAAMTFIILPVLISLILLLVTIVVFLLWRTACINRLDGVTGDCMGALVELQEACMLIALALMLTGEM
jgi:adenosylcobinamide-GDP ribazoletransferase